ncbi:MAG: type II toxin-antitoxin system RelE/ParE family toxin [Deltaproteobacteria bacterium]|nr:type II toxin-antitoxin system RelE/ParE family toxin [Deltaproteobacteria bacterium]
MNTAYRKHFLKELSKLPSEYRTKIEDFVFKELPEAETISELEKLEQMKGYPGYYKVRFGTYRVGLKLENNTLILERVLHRKEIYKFFP